MQSAITPFTEPLLELFHRALSDQEPEVLSNAAFAIGLLVEHSRTELSPQYLPLLAALQPLFSVTAESPPASLNAKDNATGAVARLIIRNTAAMPLNQVLPLFIAALPLKNDYLENGPVFRAIFHLFGTGNALDPFIDSLLSIFAFVLRPTKPTQLDEDTKNQLLQLIAHLNIQYPAQVQAAGLGVYLPGGA